MMKSSFLLACTLLLLSQLSAQIPSEVISEIDKRVLSEDHPSIVIGMYKNGQASYYTAGYQNIEHKIKATETTLYEIGSISKTFTSLLLAKYVAKNKLQVDDPISRYLPDSLQLKDDAGTEISFKHLSTHTSGLLRLPFGYSPPDWSNPYLGYYRDNLFLYLKNFKPGTVGTTHAYSNLAVGLLGETLAYIEGVSYKTLIQTEILSPLGLEHTYFEIPEDQSSHFATPYAKNEVVSSWEFDVMAPAGALRADIKDLIKYGVSYLEENELSVAQKLTTQTFYEAKAQPTLGLAWFKNGNTISHGGGTGGFRTHLVIDLEKNIVAAVMTNTADKDPSDLANYIIDPAANTMFNEKGASVEISEEELKLYTGNYTNEQYGLNFTVSVINKTLHVKLNSQSALPVDFMGSHTFQNNSVKARFLFAIEGNEVESLTLFQGGMNVTCKKI